MSKDDKQKPPMPTTGPEIEKHDADLVVVEVTHPRGVKEDGKVYRKGQTLTLLRGHTRQQNHNRPDKVYRILTTVKHVKDPNVEATFEDPSPDDDGPIAIS